MVKQRIRAELLGTASTTVDLDPWTRGQQTRRTSNRQLGKSEYYPDSFLFQAQAGSSVSKLKVFQMPHQSQAPILVFDSVICSYTSPSTIAQSHFTIFPGDYMQHANSDSISSHSLTLDFLKRNQSSPRIECPDEWL
jgi:hypothetical protein